MKREWSVWLAREGNYVLFSVFCRAWLVVVVPMLVGTVALGTSRQPTSTVMSVATTWAYSRIDVMNVGVDRVDWLNSKRTWPLCMATVSTRLSVRIAPRTSRGKVT